MAYARSFTIAKTFSQLFSMKAMFSRCPLKTMYCFPHNSIVFITHLNISRLCCTLSIHWLSYPYVKDGFSNLSVKPLDAAIAVKLEWLLRYYQFLKTHKVFPVWFFSLHRRQQAESFILFCTINVYSINQWKLRDLSFPCEHFTRNI